MMGSPYASGGRQWLRVRTPDGREAWVDDAQLSSHSDIIPMPPAAKCREDRNLSCETAVAAALRASGCPAVPGSLQ